MHETSLTPAEIQARFNQADEAMARAHAAGQKFADAVTTMTSAAWRGVSSNRFGQTMAGHSDHLQTRINRHQHIVDTGKSTASTIQQSDAQI